jgi:hypothetical protein
VNNLLLQATCATFTNHAAQCARSNMRKFKNISVICYNTFLTYVFKAA